MLHLLFQLFPASLINTLLFIKTITRSIRIHHSTTHKIRWISKGPDACSTKKRNLLCVSVERMCQHKRTSTNEKSSPTLNVSVQKGDTKTWLVFKIHMQTLSVSCVNIYVRVRVCVHVLSMSSFSTYPVKSWQISWKYVSVSHPRLQYFKCLKSVFLSVYNCAWNVEFLASSHI